MSDPWAQFPDSEQQAPAADQWGAFPDAPQGADIKSIATSTPGRSVSQRTSADGRGIVTQSPPQSYANSIQAMALGRSVQPKTSQMLGFEQGVGNFLANAASMPIRAGRALGLNMDDFQQGGDIMRNPEHDPNTTPGNVGRVGADVLESAPEMLTGGSFWGGLASGALNSSAKTNAGVTTDALISGLGGKLTDMTLGAAKRVLAPTVSPYVQQLLNAKIPLTAGQTIGGVAQQIENKATSLPFIGDAIKSAQGRSTQGLNRAVANRSLAPIGQSLPADVPVGRQAVDYVGSALGDKYDSILPNLNAKVDPQFVTDMQQIVSDAQSKLPKPQYDQFQKLLNTQISGKASAGTFDGDTIQGINSTLKSSAQGYKSDAQFDNRLLGQSLGDVHKAFRDMVARSNPDSAADLSATDLGYANFARMRRAASSTGAQDGVFSAAQLQGAVKASDKSAGKGAFARGDALMQDLSDAAKNVMQTTPDSGTAGRMLNAAALGEAVTNPHLVLASLAARPVYSRTGQAIIRGLVAGKRPAAAGYAAQLADLARRPAAVGAAALAPTLIEPDD